VTGLFPAPVVPYVRLADVAMRAQWVTPPRRLLDYLLFYVQEGRCAVDVDGDEIVLGDGDVILMQPDRLHSLRGIGTTVTPFVHFDVFYNPRRTESFATKGGQVSLASFGHLMQPRLDDLDWIEIPVKLSPPHPVQFQSTLVRIVELWQEADALSRLQADHLTMDLLLTIFKQHGHVAPPAVHPRRSLGWVPSYLSFHIGEPVSVADLADRARLSPSRFATVFREDFGLSPHQYFLRLRIEHAQDLLKGTDLPLKLIAEYCGFADVHHFSKAFKRRVRLSPGAFRDGSRATDAGGS
jgi:AraC-like DNA-binding protein